MLDRFVKFMTVDTDCVNKGRHQISFDQQRIYQFPNNRGASVVRRMQVSPDYSHILWGTYGAEDYLWELAVLRFDGEDWTIDYGTGITEDVIGYLTDEDVQGYLVQIMALPEEDQA